MSERAPSPQLEVSSSLRRGIHHSIHNPQYVAAAPAHESPNIAAANPEIVSSSGNKTTAKGQETISAATGTSDQPATHFFIVRPAGSDGVKAALVPLIPIDLLPDYIEVVGLPRSLPAAQATGMTSLGVINKPAGRPDLRYNLRFVRQDRGTPSKTGGAASVPGNSSEAPGLAHRDARRNTALPTDPKGSAWDEELSSTEGFSSTYSSSSMDGDGPIADAPTRAGPVSTSTTKEVTAAGSPPATTPSPAASPDNAAAGIQRILEAAAEASAHCLVDRPSKAKNNKGSKGKSPGKLNKDGDAGDDAGVGSDNVAKNGAGNYCRHFCAHGTCKWGLACRYQHSMPTTPEGLREVGLEEWPAWFRTAMRLITLDGRMCGPQQLEVGMGHLGAPPPPPPPPHHHHGHYAHQPQPQNRSLDFGGGSHHHHHQQQQHHVAGMNGISPGHVPTGMGLNMGMGVPPLDMLVAAAAASSLSPGGLGQVPRGGISGNVAAKNKTLSPAEKKKRDRDRERRKAMARMRELEAGANRAEMERAERLRMSKAMKMSAAHAAAEAEAAAQATVEGAAKIKDATVTEGRLGSGAERHVVHAGKDEIRNIGGGGGGGCGGNVLVDI